MKTSKKALEIINEFREWDSNWRRYDKGFRFKDEDIPMNANQFAAFLTEEYDLKDE